jgi:hypothetical protein
MAAWGRHRLPRQASPAWAIALLRGALAESGPGTSPYRDGLSLVTGMVVPQRPACSNHAPGGAFLERHGTTRPITPGVLKLVHSDLGRWGSTRRRAIPVAQVGALNVG